MKVVARPNYIGNGLVYDRDGNLLVCEHVTSSVVAIRPNGDRAVVAFHYGGRYLNSPNDVVTHSDGSVWFTDPDYGRWEHVVGVARARDLDFHGVFRVPPGGGELELVVERDAFDQPNGLCFSPDERTLYVNDLRGITAFDVDGGALRNARPFCRGMESDAGPGQGDPDGMKCDEHGNVWCTARGGIWVLNPSGELLGVVETPEVAANLAWGGPDWRSLFVCTSTTVHLLPTLVGPAPLPYH
jgi:gluconolactonase